MANITYIVPTSNIDKWNEEKVKELILNEFPQFNFDGSSIRYKGREVTYFIFGDSVKYLIDYESDIKDLNENGMFDLAEKLENLKEINPDLNNVVSTRHSGLHREKNSIDMFLKDYFKAYIFDEGIHPEFIPPEFIPTMTLKNRKSFLKGFKDFFKK